MEKNKVKVEFEISGDKFNPNKISEMLGITPTKTRIKGETGRLKHIINKYTIWLYDIGYQESEDINDQIKEVYDKLKDKIPILKQIKTLYDVEFTICVVIEIYLDKMPAISIDDWLIEFLHEVDAHVVFDTYLLN